MLFGVTFLLAWALYQVSMAIRKIGASRLGILYFYLVAPGVACHETGHALGCLLTGKRIVEFVPFHPQADDNGVVLGYVKHESSPEILSRAGEFVVATGPVWFGTVIILILVRLLAGPSSLIDFAQSAGVNAATPVLPYLHQVAIATSELASRVASVWRWHGPLDFLWGYLLICVASEVTLSGPDMRGMWVGFVAICSLVVIGNFVPIVDMLLENGMRSLAPFMFIIHSSLAFVLLLDVCLLGLFSFADMSFKKLSGKKEKNNKLTEGNDK